jgi:hypothetical protein
VSCEASAGAYSKGNNQPPGRSVWDDAAILRDGLSD